MKNTAYIALLGASMLMACGGSSDEKVTEEVEEVVANDWVNLFDGESFDGWKKFGGEEVGAAWKVQDGAIYLDATNKKDWQTADGGDIVTEGEFDNFHFQVEWKISKDGNSGIMFFVQDTGEYAYPWMTGPEMQVLDNDGHPDAKIRTHRAGDLYDLIESSEEMAKPVGEWNLAEIIAKDGNLELHLNGTMVVSTTMWTPEWEEMIANSKFKDMPGFGKYKKGRISLQDHGDEVWFRNIRIKQL
ncbi:MAG: 3-keto-disaccharide hydrolase [Mongoliitalea sp.]